MTPPDLRLVLPAVAAWAGVLAGFGLPWWAWAVAVLAGAAFAAWWGSLALAAAVTAAGVGAGAASLRERAVEQSLLAEAAQDRAHVTLTLRVTSDPVAHRGSFGDYIVVRGSARTVARWGVAHQTRAPVLVVGAADWSRASLGSTVQVSGRLAPADSTDLAGRVSVTRDPLVLEPPPRLYRAAEAVRGWIRAATAGASPVARELVPALVVGDDAGLPDEVTQEFRVAGLTHLTAVSGTNLTLVVGFLLIVARWCGVRSRGLLAVGILGVAGFVLVARPEPSVVRAAAMGSVVLLGMGTGGARRGVRALAAAVLVLLLLDPWLGLSFGFALSATATAGILFLAPPLRDALQGWLPRWVAEAIAVPFAAQVACTPMVAALSGAVSLVAVLANLLVAPVVGPATVFGLVGGLVWPLWPWLGGLLGRLAGFSADWVVSVADRAAAVPAGSLGWPTDAPSLAVLTVACAVVALAAPRFARRPVRSVLVVGVLVLAMLRPLPDPGWPPTGWVMVACDVGQGDGLVLNAGGGAAVVVDVGPEPAAIDRCLRRLEVRRVPVLLLTHFHADHVDGLPGVLRGRQVGEIHVTGLRDPAYGAEQVDREAAGYQLRVPAYGELRRVGAVSWQVLGPLDPSSGRTGEEGSAANNASLVVLAQVAGVRLLLTGDAEPEAQRRLERSVGTLAVDVLKVPHHGSRYQDPEFLSRLGARLAVVSAGDDNDYGHPAPDTLELLRSAGMEVRRTDRDGDIAVVVRDDQLRVHTSQRATSTDPGGAVGAL